ncbi:MAG: DUF4335 domain-containing protein [Leptolyngbyaceae cyanobacterium]
MSYSVLRRYTPPTCTLEILGRRSPLSRWSSREILSALRFRLRLDDPTLPQAQWFTLTGDRHQLEALVETVTNYVQSRLVAPDLMQVSASKADDRGFSGLWQATPTAQNERTGIALRPKGQLTHELCLGNFAPEGSGKTAELTTLQLFDLANALEEYSGEIETLPALTKSSGWLPDRVGWPQMAAVALVTIGLAVSIAKVLDRPQSTSTAVAPNNSQAATSTDQRLALQLPPAVTAQKTVPPSTSAQPLPPPPPPGALVPRAPGLPKVTVPAAVPINPGVATVPIAPLPPSGINQGQSTVDVPGLPTVMAQKPEMSTPIAPPPGATSGDMAAAPAPIPMTATAARADAAARSNNSKQSAETSATAFDTIPQVAEARRYFQQRWQVPNGLTQTLEYRLSVNPDGTVQRIIPLGQAAGDFIDRTAIPLVGEPLVAPIASGKGIQLRLVFNPDGSVQTFLEGD